MSLFKRTGTGINEVEWDTTDYATKAEVTELNTKVDNISGGGTTLPYLPLSGGKMTGNIDMALHKITGIVSPTVPTDAVNKNYLTQNYSTTTENNAKYLTLTGGTMTGNLNMGDNQITNVNTLTATNIIVKGTSEASASIKVTGDASRSEIDLNDASNNPVVIKGVDTPADNNDGANKAYVDAVDAKLTVVNGELTGVKNSVTTLTETVNGITGGTETLPYLPLTGGTITGDVSMSGNDITSTNRVFTRKIYFRTDAGNVADVTPSKQDTQSILTLSDTNANTVMVKGVATPVADTDAVNKAYVDLLKWIEDYKAMIKVIAGE